MTKALHSKNSFFLSLRILLLFIFVLLKTDSRAQDQNLFFSNITIENGLASNVTNSIIEDEYGFIWIGTQEGVCRYDGYKFVIFKNKQDQSSLPSNNISSLLLDNDTIWVGTWGGLCTINIRTFQIKRVNLGQSKSIRALHKDLWGNIWIGTSSGLIVYDKKLNQYKPFDTANSHISHNTIRAFYQAKNGDMWIGTYDKINLYKGGKFTSFDLKGSYKPWLQNNLICTIKPFSKQNDSLLWIGTETGLCLFNTKTKKQIVYTSNNTNLSNEVIKCVYSQNDSILWLGTDFGLNIFNIKTKEVHSFYHDPVIGSTISNNVIWEIFDDSKGRLWFITSNGVSLLNNNQNLYSFHEEYHSLAYPKIGNQIRDILVDKNNGIWLASIYGVIHHNTNGETNKYMANDASNHPLLLNNVYALKEDCYGRIWIGTAGGINIWDKEKQKMFAISSNTKNGLSSNYIHSFAAHDSSTFWVSAWEGGLFRVVDGFNEPEKMRFIKVDTDGDGRVINAGGQIYYGSHKKLWAIDLKTYEKKAIEKVNEVLHEKEIASITGGKNGDVWIGTDNQLIKYSSKTNSVNTIDINLGAPTKLISLEEGKDGTIWASTNHSIIKINIDSKTYHSITINPNSPLKSFYQNCSAISPDGTLLFGGENGYIKISPPELLLPTMAPKVYITSLLINNQEYTTVDSVDLAKENIAFRRILELKHNQNSIQFEFSTLDFLFPDASLFAYRLKGHDASWQYTSNGKNFAVFSNLSPGDYVFELKGSNHFGVWSKTKTLKIIINPPLWLSIPFLILYFVLTVALSYFIYRVLRYRHRLNQELKMAKLEKQHAEELFQAKQQFFTNVSHEFRTPLSLILPPIQQMMKSEITNPKNKKLLKLANRNAKRLYTLVNQLLDFGKIESSKLNLQPSGLELVSFCKYVFGSFKDMARRHEIDYKFSSEIDVFYTEADPEKLETILFNLLSNAFKYTEFGGEITFKIQSLNKTEKDSSVAIQIIDSGTGIPKNEQKNIFERFYQTSESKALKLGTGIGLTLAQEYAKLHNGEIKVKSEPNKGSTFTLYLPLKELSDLKHETGSKIGQSDMSKTLNHQLKKDQKGPKVLIIDDNEDILDYIEMNLVEHYQIRRASNGKEGLKAVKGFQPDLIISDIMMPEMDGIEFCSKVKEDQSVAHIPIILLTAKALEQQKIEGMKIGAAMYITKPFNIDYFKSCIESVFRSEEQFRKYIKTELLLKPEEKNKEENNLDEIFLRKVISIIENNISNPELSVEMISIEIGISSTHLYRKLKSMTNQSTSDIIKNYRMQKAAQMIKNKEGNINEIMYAVGFSSPSSFSKSFKSVFNVSPGKYLQE